MPRFVEFDVHLIFSQLKAKEGFLRSANLVIFRRQKYWGTVSLMRSWGSSIFFFVLLILHGPSHADFFSVRCELALLHDYVQVASFAQGVLQNVRDSGEIRGLRPGEPRSARLGARNLSQVWPHPQKTPLSVVHIHGFGSAPGAMRDMAEGTYHLGANVVNVRLAGHGTHSADLTPARAREWLSDVQAAVQLAEKMGDRVILVGHSTGAPLAALAYQRMPERVAGMFFVAPHFGLVRWADGLLNIVNWIWPSKIIRKPGAPEEYHSAYRDISVAASQSTKLLAREAFSIPEGEIQVPVKIVVLPNDSVVSRERAQAFAERHGLEERDFVVLPRHPDNRSLHGDLHYRESPHFDRLMNELMELMERTGVSPEMF